MISNSKLNFIPLIVNTNELEELFPHLNKLYPSFCLFNIMIKK
jgi:hypothetical protein